MSSLLNKEKGYIRRKTKGAYSSQDPEDCNNYKNCKMCNAKIYWWPDSRQPFNAIENTEHHCHWRTGYRYGERE